MVGSSWLAITDFGIATEQLPHLAAVGPLEGLADPVREELFPGGIPYTVFSQFIAAWLPGNATF